MPRNLKNNSAPPTCRQDPCWHFSIPLNEYERMNSPLSDCSYQQQRKRRDNNSLHTVQGTSFNPNLQSIDRVNMSRQFNNQFRDKWWDAAAIGFTRLEMFARAPVVIFISPANEAGQGLGCIHLSHLDAVKKGRWKSTALATPDRTGKVP